MNPAIIAMICVTALFGIPGLVAAYVQERRTKASKKTGVAGAHSS